MTDTGTAEILRDLAHRTAKPEVVEPGKHYVWRNLDGGLIERDLTADLPARKTGTVTVLDVPSFQAYFDKHASTDAEVYADIDKATITAVLDAHTKSDGARWENHKLVLSLQFTPEWEAWKQHDREMLPQVAFAEFLEDHYRDVAPGPDAINPEVQHHTTGADLLEIAQKFQAATQVKFESGTRLASGETQLHWAETTEARSGSRGDVVIPTIFQIAVPPYEASGNRRRITARFRYRTASDGLQLGYFLDSPGRFLRESFDEVVTAVAVVIDTDIMQGRPAR
jgi:uncharacterized protein YfdQ (DUF2303 family)